MLRRLRGFEGVKGAGYSPETIDIYLLASWHKIFCEVVRFSRSSNKCLRTDGRTDGEIFAIPKLLSELKITSTKVPYAPQT